MSKSRFGGFRVGKKRILNDWDNRKSNSSNASAPATVLDLDYSTAQGIWNLNSTVQFSKQSLSSIPLGLSTSLFQTSGVLDAWSEKTVDISSYATKTVRLVFKYTMIGANFTSDIQLDNINIDGNIYSFENTGESWQTSGSGETDYSSVTWSNVAVATTGGRWNSDTGGTPSNGTARTDAASGSYYVYAETSSPGNVVGFVFWLRSPEIILDSSPTLTYYEARNGTNLGNLDVHLDVIS